MGHTTHNQSYSRIYHIWDNMKQRCNNPKKPCYKNYGGRGIYVCKEWDTSFEAFFADMGSTYKDDLSIDRIDNNGPYSLDNCKWSTRKEQQRNSRHNRHITINGTTKLLCEWLEENKITPITFYMRTYTGWPEDIAASYPVDQHNNNVCKSLSHKRLRSS